MSTIVYLKDVVTLKFDESKCNGCGLCITVCPHAVFEIENKKAKIIKRDYCIECGACAQNCSKKAICVKSFVPML